MLAYRSRELVNRISKRIAELASGETLRFCHVCGTHELCITRHGLRSLLPEGVEVVAGPGCPVCVTPATDIDAAIELARQGCTITTFGDLLRVPGSKQSLAQARTEGGDVRVVYSITDAVKLARKNPDREVVHVSIGFETTASTTAAEVLRDPPKNFSLLVCHRLIPPSMELLLGMGELHIDGFIAPGHVSTIIGLEPYEVFPRAYGMPVVIAGFEPVDVMLALLMLVRQARAGEARLENEYTRSVTPRGNVRAQKLIKRAFEVVDGHWRGLGKLPSSAFSLKEEFSAYDARRKHQLEEREARDLLPGCNCNLVMVGKIYPHECPLYGKTCTPQAPKGPCMVSTEGTCNIAFKYGRKA